MRHSTDIGTHPDIMEMRARYEAASANPTMQTADGLNMVAGLYLALSPWIVGFQNLTGITVNNLITGLLVSMLALSYSSAFGRTYGLSWVAPLIGVWTIVAPWLVRGATEGRTIINNVIIGAIILALGLATMRLGMMQQGRTGGGYERSTGFERPGGGFDRPQQS
ncbi:hypothetical protein TBS_06780 [Thermobispora bispora]|mgnify:FL=1|jgi:hypothetical protein|uniref:SPW repeat protein n=1 Tax=Thermobispora bispora (strain ATCC 19993 / DSM 43833 / CBS 139.67 / JCM 10125 / KCTC 9307 / NBRC 14880 / R51) TaxID=469371 RepID=D6YB23_THEBD|nr:SPW repeat protein [Thermobispora bispora]ADG88383.1 SPW repeat protein [Thermobispora bispora DSM 43833]MDI9582482.1 SPW repeat protein [Thermobispora sp.]